MTDNTSNASRIQSICLAILTVIAVMVSLSYLKAIMIPLAFSIFIFFMMNPLIGLLTVRAKVPRPIAVTLALTATLLFSALLVLIISNSIQSLLAGAKIYESTFNQLLTSLVARLESIGFASANKIIQSQFEAERILSWARQVSGQFMGVIGNFVLISIYLLFLFTGNSTRETPPIFHEIQHKVSRYFWTKFVISSVTGTCVAIILSLIGLDLAFVFGVLVFLLNFIPNIGSLIATLLPLPIALLQFGFTAPTLTVLVVPGAIQFLMGNVLEPKILGRSLGLHPVALLFFLLFWGIVWGLPGMFLAVPIMAVTRFVLERFESTRFVADLLAGDLNSSIRHMHLRSERKT